MSLTPGSIQNVTKVTVITKDESLIKSDHLNNDYESLIGITTFFGQFQNLLIV